MDITAILALRFKSGTTILEQAAPAHAASVRQFQKLADSILSTLAADLLETPELPGYYTSTVGSQEVSAGFLWQLRIKRRTGALSRWCFNPSRRSESVNQRGRASDQRDLARVSMVGLGAASVVKQPRFRGAEILVRVRANHRPQGTGFGFLIRACCTTDVEIRYP